MITQSIKLNLIPGGIPQRIRISQYDEGSRTLTFTLYNGNTAFTATGVTAQIRGTKPDAKGFAYDASYSAGVVTASLTQQISCVAGDVECELILSKDNEILGTANFILEVEKAALGEDADISETEIPAIIDAARSSAAAAAASATKSESYAVGGTSSRTGEDTDNAKYYKEQAAASATNAANSQSSASQSATAAAESATAASNSASAAASSNTAAAGHEANALAYRNEAKEYRDQAAGYAGEASYSFMVDDAGYICLNRKEDEA